MRFARAFSFGVCWEALCRAAAPEAESSAVGFASAGSSQTIKCGRYYECDTVSPDKRGVCRGGRNRAGISEKIPRINPLPRDVTPSVGFWKTEYSPCWIIYVDILAGYNPGRPCARKVGIILTNGFAQSQKCWKWEGREGWGVSWREFGFSESLGANTATRFKITDWIIADKQLICRELGVRGLLCYWLWAWSQICGIFKTQNWGSTWKCKKRAHFCSRFEVRGPFFVFLCQICHFVSWCIFYQCKEWISTSCGC